MKYSKVIFYCHFPDQLLSNHSNVFRRIYRYPFDFIEKFSMSYASEILCNSLFTKTIIQNVFGDDIASQTKVLYPCVDDKVNDVNVENNLDENRFLSINRFERKKNIELAISAAAHFETICKKKYLLTIAGGYDERLPENVQYYDELVELAKYHKVNVNFERSISDERKSKLIKSATCIIYTPSNEHFGIVPLDAMCYGKPVLAVNSGGPLETVISNQTGYLLSPSKEAFAEHMKILAENKDIAVKFGIQGKKRVEEVFSYQKFKERMSKLLEE